MVVQELQQLLDGPSTFQAGYTNIHQVDTHGHYQLSLRRSQDGGARPVLVQKGDSGSIHF